METACAVDGMLNELRSLRERVYQLEETIADYEKRLSRFCTACILIGFTFGFLTAFVVLK